MKFLRVRLTTIALLAGLVLASFAESAAQGIPSPEDFFGHPMGADRQLVGWDALVTYYETVDALSDRVEVRNVGPSTLGNPFLVIFVSSPANLADLDDIRRYNAVLQDPRGGRRPRCWTPSTKARSSWSRGTGCTRPRWRGRRPRRRPSTRWPRRRDAQMQEILDNTVSIIVPSMNPDGTNLVTDWYNRWVGSEYEGVGPPELYHHYVGHDNNRDAFMQNTVESRYVAEILFREWIPQAFIDHHQMGAIYCAHLSAPVRRAHQARRRPARVA